MMTRHDKERAVRRALSLAALIAGSISALIFFFLFYFSLPILSSGLIGQFLTHGWDPDRGVLGIFPMIVGTVYIAGLAMIWVTPIAIGLAAFIQVFAPKPLAKILRWTVEFMTGIPTVVYGFAALFFLVPAMRRIFSYGTGLSVLTASLMLALFLGTAALPHVLIRYYTVPSSAFARKSTIVAVAAIGLFYLLTLYCVLRGVDAPRAGVRWTWFVGAIIACALSMGCKAVAAKPSSNWHALQSSADSEPASICPATASRVRALSVPISAKAVASMAWSAVSHGFPERNPHGRCNPAHSAMK